MLLRSDLHVRGGLPSHTVHGSLMLSIAYVTVFIIADMRIISYIFLFVKSYIEKILLIKNMTETVITGRVSTKSGIFMPGSVFLS